MSFLSEGRGFPLIVVTKTQLCHACVQLWCITSFVCLHVSISIYGIVDVILPNICYPFSLRIPLTRSAENHTYPSDF
jgi:hypothetical protein